MQDTTSEKYTAGPQTDEIKTWFCETHDTISLLLSAFFSPFLTNSNIFVFRALSVT